MKVIVAKVEDDSIAFVVEFKGVPSLIPQGSRDRDRIVIAISNLAEEYLEEPYYLRFEDERSEP